MLFYLFEFLGSLLQLSVRILHHDVMTPAQPKIFL